MSLLSQVIEVGKNDDLEDSKSISDDTDIEVTSEVWVSSKRAVLHHPRLQMLMFQQFTCVEECHIPHFYLPFLGRGIGFFTSC